MTTAKRYVLAVANYNRYVDEIGKVPPSFPPVVPKAAALTPPDSVSGLQWYTMTTTPLVDPPLALHVPVDTTVVPNTIIVGKRMGTSKWFSAGQLDSFPNGMQTPPNTISADGIMGVFEKFGNPTTSNGAVHGVYLLVS
jgi:hypothetical protein